jgi:hypothetical protein
MGSHKVNIIIQLLYGVTKSTDYLLVRPMCVTYESGSVMAVVEVYYIVQDQHISNRNCNNFRTINNECWQTIVSIVQCKGMKSQFFV